MILYTVIVASNSVYSLASIFLPKIFEEKEIPGFWVGLIFSMYSIASVISSPFIGTLITKCGFANLIAFGLTAMGASIIPFAFIKGIENDTTSLVLGLLLRTLQGVASASINTTCFSLAATKYSDNTEFVVGMMEGVSGIGLVFGLMGGSVIFEAMGYMAVFIGFGSILPILAIVSRMLFYCIEKKELACEAERQANALLQDSNGS